MLDTGLWLFTGLVVLFVWRYVAWWTRFQSVNRYLNYMYVLLALVLGIICYDSYILCTTFSIHSTQSAPMWLRVLAYASYPTIYIMFIICTWQIYTHVEKIKEDSAVLWHDRAINVLALPIVYAAMMLSCMTKCLLALLDDTTPAGLQQRPIAVAEGQTCSWIGDLFESWALYQFGVLMLEVMERSLVKQSSSLDSAERAAANGLLVAHKAVSSLAWLGILSFVLVSVADSGVALFFLTFVNHEPHLLQKFNAAESAFDVAGFLASGAAIYNVYVVESQFTPFFEEIMPFLKFLTVKILVTFAYGQLYIFQGLRILDKLFPVGFQHFLRSIPGISWLIECNDAQFYVFYSALLVFECFAIAVTHVFAWKASEEWYDSQEDEKSLIQQSDFVIYGTSNA